MAKAKIVIALGGNALQDVNGDPTAEAQLAVVKKTCRYLADIVCSDYQVALVHGNGPQVGRIVLASETARDVTPAMPFDVCGAMSQGYIGYHLQNAIINEMRARRIVQDVVTVVTEVLVDRADPAFADPSKPVGSFYTKDQAEELAVSRGYVMKEDAGRGYRRVVPSPKPMRIIGIKAIRSILDSGHVVIAGGGGGIPMIEDEDRHLTGVAAVIDKDFTSELLAESLDADAFIILTAVEKVAIRFGKPDQMWLSELSADEAARHIENGEFAKGSMLPKVEAALKYAQSKPGRRALITSLERAREALDGKTGTWISN